MTTAHLAGGEFLLHLLRHGPQWGADVWQVGRVRVQGGRNLLSWEEVSSKKGVDGCMGLAEPHTTWLDRP